MRSEPLREVLQGKQVAEGSVSQTHRQPIDAPLTILHARVDILLFFFFFFQNAHSHQDDKVQALEKVHCSISLLPSDAQIFAGSDQPVAFHVFLLADDAGVASFSPVPSLAQ